METALLTGKLFDKLIVKATALQPHDHVGVRHIVIHFLAREEISQAFETMGKPLSKIELDTFMDSLEGDSDVLDLVQFSTCLEFSLV